MGKNRTVAAPQPTAAETALTQEQTQLLRDQRAQMQEQLRMQDLLAPLMYQQAGLKPIYGTSNGITAQNAGNISLLEGQMQAERDAFSQQFGSSPPPVGPDGMPDANWKAQYDALQSRLAPLQTRLTQLQNPRTNQIVGFEQLPETPEEMRARQMEELSFQRATSAFEMEQARFAQEKADLPALQRQRELETAFRERSLADLNEQATARAANAEVEGLIRARTLAALKGELPVNPALMRELGEGEDTLRASLLKQLGTGFETSTPGIQALAEFGKRKSEILEGARRGDLQLGEQMNFAREAGRSQRLTEALPVLASRLNPSGANFDAINQTYAGMGFGAGLRQQQLANMLLPSQASMPITMGLGNVAAGYNSPISAFQGQRQQDFAASIQNQNARSQQQAGYGSMFGTALMAAAMFF